MDLAAGVVGTLDVDGMLDSIDPHTFNEWIAYRQETPDPVDRICAILRFGFWMLVSAWATDDFSMKPCQFDPLGPQEPEEQLSPDQAAQATAMQLGPGQSGKRNGHGNR